MLPSEIILAARRTLGTAEHPSDWQTNDVDLMWGNAELVGYLDDARGEFLERRLLVDSTGEGPGLIELEANLADYPLDPLVLSVSHGWLDDGTKLEKVSVAYLDASYSGWRDAGATWPPRYILADTHTATTLKVYPPPSQAGNLHLAISRLPLESLLEVWTDTGSFTDLDYVELEVPPRYHRALVHWILAQAFLKSDADTYQKNQADHHMALFDREVGPPRSAASAEFVDAFSGAGPTVMASYR